MSLKMDPDSDYPDQPGSKLTPTSLNWMREVAGSNAETAEDVIKLRDERVFRALQVFKQKK